MRSALAAYSHASRETRLRTKLHHPRPEQLLRRNGHIVLIVWYKVLMERGDAQEKVQFGTEKLSSLGRPTFLARCE